MAAQRIHETLLEALRDCEAVPEEPVGLIQALVAWFQIIDALGDDVRRERFLARLNPAQTRSLDLLREWWSGDIVNNLGRNLARGFLFTMGSTWGPLPDTDDPDLVSIFDQPVESAYYHLYCVQLFEAELGDKFFNRQIVAQQEEIVNARTRALQYAAAQRIAISFVGNEKPNIAGDEHGGSTQGRSRQPTATAQACPWLDPDEIKGLPYYLWDIDRKCTVQTRDLGDSANDYMCISHTWGRWLDPQGSAKVEGVPWLVPRNTIFSVEELPQCLHDACLPTRYVWFDLFCIPQDRSKKAAEEIARQAAIFNSAKHCAIWFNTLAGWDSLLASIKYLAWTYNKCSSWGNGAAVRLENSSITIPDLLQLKTPGPDELVWRDNAQQPCTFLTLSNDADHPTDICGWFTSLWTLQEFCLRPDMILLDADLTQLSTLTGSPIHLDELIALYNAADEVSRPTSFQAFTHELLNHMGKQGHGMTEILEAGREISTHIARIDHTHDPKKWPYGAQGLGYAIDSTGIGVSHIMTPTMIFGLGERRQCTSRRAEAIMSVIGATAWFQEIVDQIQADGSIPEPDLVLGRYPLSFLREAAQKIGASFYGSNFFAPYTAPDRFPDVFPPDMQPVGSLLPFSGAGSPFRRSFDAAPTYSPQGHEHVATWLIQSDGSVHIREAIVVASTSYTDHRAPFMAYFSSRILNTPDFSDTCMMDEWLEAKRPSDRSLHLHAVLLTHSFASLVGVLLQDLSPTTTLLPKRMLKVGTWAGVNLASLEFEKPPKSSVDWLVL